MNPYGAGPEFFYCKAENLKNNRVIMLLPATTIGGQERWAKPGDLAVTCRRTPKGRRVAVRNGCYFTIEGWVLVKDLPDENNCRCPWHGHLPACHHHKEQVSFYYPLFEHMSQNHGLILLDSELADIVRVCESLMGVEALIRLTRSHIYKTIASKNPGTPFYAQDDSSPSL